MPLRKDGNKLRPVFIRFECIDIIHILAKEIGHERRIKQTSISVGIIVGINSPEKSSPFGAFAAPEQIVIHVAQERNTGLFHSVFNILQFCTGSR